MTSDLILILLIGINLALVILEIILLIHLRDERILLNKEKSDIVAGSKELHLAKEKSVSLLHRAMKQANAILVSAELEGIGLFSRQKLDTDKITRKYTERLQVFESMMEKEFEMSLQKVDKDYKDLITSTEKTISKHVAENQKLLEEKANTLIISAQHSLNMFVEDVQKNVKDQVAKELAAARSFVDEYKQRRLAVVDNSVLEILEKTLSITLAKSLSIQDKSEFIYKALEEAKSQHIFI